MSTLPTIKLTAGPIIVSLRVLKIEHRQDREKNRDASVKNRGGAERNNEIVREKIRDHKDDDVGDEQNNHVPSPSLEHFSLPR
jgi:hypothetical protein